MSAPVLDRPTRVGRVRVRRRSRTWLVLLAAAVVGGAAWLVWVSPVLTVKDVRVVDIAGAGFAPEVQAQVLAVAAVPTGIPLARFDADAARARVAALPWIGEVDVRRGWPNEVVVAIATRTVAARTPDGRAVDADGTVFDALSPSDKRLPIVDATDVGRAAAMAVLRTLPSDLGRRVVSITASSLDDVELRLRSGDLVRWGSPQDAELKASVLAALMGRKADMYDVSAPGLPTTYRRP